MFQILLLKFLIADTITPKFGISIKNGMIGKLKGIIESCKDGQSIIDVNGVGYLVFCSGKTLSHLLPGEFTELIIETHVREDHIHLYGFYNNEEKETFNILQSVKGVGTRMALAILSALTPEDILLALSSQDNLIFQSIPGVGKKLAERIITELKDKNIPTITVPNYTNTNQTSSMQIINNDIASDAISALTSLGISRSEAQLRVNNITNKHPEISLNELIKNGLKTQ